MKSTRSRPTLVRVKTYCSSNIKSMVFANGAIQTKAGLRFGWSALRALKKPDGFHCLPLGDFTVGAQCAAGEATAAVTCESGLVCVGANASNTNISCESP